MSNLVNIKQLNMTTFGSSPHYFYEFIKNIPILTHEQEIELFTDMNVKGCLEAAHKLIIHNLRYVYMVCNNNRGYKLPYEDMVQEGIIGLMKGIKNFDATKGVPLVGYATHYIENAVREYIITNWNMVKITTTHENKRLFFNLRKHVSDFKHPSTHEVKTASLKLGVSEKEIVSFTQRLGYGECSIDSPPLGIEYDDSYGITLGDTLTDDSTIEDNLMRMDELKTLDAVNDALSLLNDREKEIIELRYLNNERKTLNELSHTYGVSTERIRQIELNAIKKIKTTLASCGVVSE